MLYLVFFHCVFIELRYTVSELQKVKIITLY